MAAVEVAMMRDTSAAYDSIYSLLECSWSTQFLCSSNITALVGKTKANNSSSKDASKFCNSDHSSCSPPLVNAKRTADCHMATDSTRDVLQDSACDISLRENSNGSACTCVGQPAYRRGRIDEAEMRKVFERFDTNADGLISRDELQQYMVRLGVELTDAQATSMVASVDLNNDHCVDFEEFLSLYESYCRCDGIADSAGEDVDDLVEAFLVFDKNRDGFISAEELQAVLLDLGMPEGKSLMSCQNMIRKVDGDGNGKCDIEEFKKMMSS